MLDGPASIPDKASAMSLSISTDATKRQKTDLHDDIDLQDPVQDPVLERKVCSHKRDMGHFNWLHRGEDASGKNVFGQCLI
jgi:hypothetical protein